MEKEEISKDVTHPPKCLKCRRRGIIVVWDNIKERYEELLYTKCREENK